MIKKIAWNTFKNTGNLDTFLELKQIQNLEKGIQEIANGKCEDKWNSNSREQNGNNKDEWHNNF